MWFHSANTLHTGAYYILLHTQLFLKRAVRVFSLKLYIRVLTRISVSSPRKLPLSSTHSSTIYVSGVWSATRQRSTSSAIRSSLREMPAEWSVAGGKRKTSEEKRIPSIAREIRKHAIHGKNIGTCITVRVWHGEHLRRSDASSKAIFW